MSNFTITIEAPEMVAAIHHLAEAISKMTASSADSNSTQPVPVASVSPTPNPTVTAPQLASVSAAVPVTTAVPVPTVVSAPTPTVPVSNAPSYTLDQISRAGAALVDAGKMEQLVSLLTKYGVSAITQLAADQYGAFAAELRALGAQL